MAFLIIKGSNWFGDELWGLGNNTDENFIQAWMSELLSGIIALWVVSQLLWRHSQALTQTLSLAILMGTLLVFVASMKNNMSKIIVVISLVVVLG